MKKKKLKADPYRKREASKYKSPIQSREFIIAFLQQSSAPVGHNELCEAFAITGEEQTEALRRRLIAMVRDGQLICNRKGAYGVVDRMDLIRGKVQGHRDGFGFVIPSDGGDDLYLSGRQMRRVFHGDDVLVRVAGVDSRGRKEAAIVDVLQRNTQELVGRYYEEQSTHFMLPDNQRITHEVLIPSSKTSGAKPGQFVVVVITEQPSKKHQPVGEVVEVLGDHLAPGMEIDVAIRCHDIPYTWPKEVEREIAALPQEVKEDDKLKRVDLRKLPFVTIDGEDARDFDDAVYCEKKKTKGWLLHVAIADVSHYVNVHSALDQAAQERGNSVYFPDHVVPMLPEQLSNGLCSLKPQVDRLCIVCEMSISGSGRVTRYQFYEAVIHSHARLTYTIVGDMLSASSDKSAAKTVQRTQYHNLIQHIDELHSLYKVLHSARDKRGAIDFETVETRIVFGERRKIQRIVPVQRNDAHKLIEECMLCANVCAAKFLETHELPALYRIHERPGGDKLTNLRQFLGELRLDLAGGKKPTSKDYQTLLASTVDRPDAHIIQTMMLRSMMQAVYMPENKGHFGLNYTAYTHFTSPIRRYTDLLVHRAIRHIIRSRKTSHLVERVKGAGVLAKKHIYPYAFKDMLQFGEHCSMTERRADEATRDVVNWLKCEYLRGHVGDDFDGRITSVTAFGLFVELTDIYIEGLVHVTALRGDYYHFDPVKQRLKGERTGASYRLGDLLTVKVIRVDLDDKKIDFELVSDHSIKSLSAKKSSKLKKNNHGQARRNQLKGKNKQKHDKNSGKSKKTKKSTVSNLSVVRKRPAKKT